MRIVQEPVTDGGGLVRIADDTVPVGGRELAGDESRGAFATFLDDFDQIPAFTIAQGRQEPVIDGQKVELGHTRQHPGVGAIAATDGQVMQEPGHARVGGGEAAATGPLDFAL